MRYVDEFRDPAAVRALAEALRRRTTRPWAVMEVCGGQTHSLARHGLAAMLPPELELLHGPGCPVCVTPTGTIDRAIAIASIPGAILCTYGDMLRVPGSRSDLRMARSAGADVRIVYSPLEALTIARENPSREVAFFAIGFETTAPGHAVLVQEAVRAGIRNLSLLVAHVRVPPALEALVRAPDHRIDGFLAAGHVCTVEGTADYARLSSSLEVPIVVTGFEPVDLLQGLLMLVTQLEQGRHEMENQYARAVAPKGNPHARARVEDVFVVAGQDWRGLGSIDGSGLALRDRYAGFDAVRRFDVGGIVGEEPSECRIGLVLTGRMKPADCPMFGVRCTPDTPLGATMVSSEGACAAHYRYRDGAAS